MNSKKSKSLSDLGGLVFSTNPNALSSQEEEPEPTPTPAEQDLRVWLEKNHRGGKVATVIKGFVGAEADLEDLGKKLKTKCGTGGSAKEGEIIIQGDHRDKIVAFLAQWGYKSKKAGA
jgi:translation initiation factor 1